MSMTVTEAAPANSPLYVRWRELMQAEPGLRARDAASKLGVSEGELVAARGGEDIVRLDGAWGEIIKKLPRLGTVMVLTRNDFAVHEKVGRFNKISIFQNMGLVLDRDIDLRIFLNHWHSGFAVTEDVRSGRRHSLQFFDVDGTAVHKVYLRGDSDMQAFREIVAAHRSSDQSAQLKVLPGVAPAPDRPDAEIDRKALLERWSALQDVHDFRDMLIDLGVGRVQALRLVEGIFAHRIGNGAFRRALDMAAAQALPIMIFAGSAGVIQIHTGPISQLKAMGPWYNVLDLGFNLHLREDGIASSWIVRKPTREGDVTSLEIYDVQDRQIAWMFGERKPGKPELEDWRALLERLGAEGTVQ